MRVAVYCRVSTDEQREKETIQTQKGFAERYCDLHQLTVIGYYLDDGVSGTIPVDKRPEGARLLADAVAGKFDTVLFYRLDRFGRDSRLIHNALGLLDEAGVQVRSMTEAFDTSTPSGKLMFGMLASFAAFERDSIIARSKEGTERLAREGIWLGGIRPFGYQVDGTKRNARITPSEEPIPGHTMSEAAVVRFIYHALAEEKRTCVWVSERLNALGIPPSYTLDGREIQQNTRKVTTAGIWRPGRIRGIVISTTYKGIHRYGKRSGQERDVIERPVPALVSEEVWQKAQDTLHGNLKTSPRNMKADYLLRGKMKCGLCGLTYVGTGFFHKKRNAEGVDVPVGEKRSYYVCNGRHAGRGKYGLVNQRCPAKSVPGAVEELVWGDIESFARNPGEVIAQLRTRYQNNDGRAERLQLDLETIQSNLSAKEKERTPYSLYSAKGG